MRLHRSFRNDPRNEPILVEQPKESDSQEIVRICCANIPAMGRETLARCCKMIVLSGHLDFEWTSALH